jgi:hypothetical protein
MPHRQGHDSRPLTSQERVRDREQRGGSPPEGGVEGPLDVLIVARLDHVEADAKPAGRGVQTLERHTLRVTPRARLAAKAAGPPSVTMTSMLSASSSDIKVERRSIRPPAARSTRSISGYPSAAMGLAKRLDVVRVDDAAGQPADSWRFPRGRLGLGAVQR